MQKCLLGYDVGYRYYRFILPSSFMEPAVVPSILQAQETAPAVSSLLLVRLLLCESVRTDVQLKTFIVFLATNVRVFFFQRKVVLVGSTEG